MNIAIIGATGLVGKEIAFLLENRNFPLNQFIPIASTQSLGNSYTFKDKLYQLTTIDIFIVNNMKNQE